MYIVHMSDYTIYTIGYTAFELDGFIRILKNYGINSLIDVRSYPVASEFYKTYSRNFLEPLLKTHNIIYRNYAKEFGARQENRKFYMPEGCLDFEKFSQSSMFLDGVEKIKKGIGLNYKFVLMCAEKDPINCHRAIMVARAMNKMGFKINHIHADGNIETQEKFDQRLLDSYRIQPSFLQTRDEQLYEVYRKKNKEIGFKGETWDD